MHDGRDELVRLHDTIKDIDELFLFKDSRSPLKLLYQIGHHPRSHILNGLVPIFGLLITTRGQARYVATSQRKILSHFHIGNVFFASTELPPPFRDGIFIEDLVY
jgi:hypothetical protein